MAAFSLWQLLNQRQPFPGDDDSDRAQRQQAAGQAIGQSLNDFWNRAGADAGAMGSDDADSNPYVDHLVYYPPPPGTPPIEPQLLPYRPNDRLGIHLAPVGTPLAAGNSAPYPGDSRSDGTPGQTGDPNINLAQLYPAIPYGLAAAVAAAAAAAEWSRQQADRVWKRTAPPPPLPQSASSPPVTSDSLNSSPDQTPPSPTTEPQFTASPDLPASPSPEATDLTTPPMPGLAVSPSVPSPTHQSPDLLSWLNRRTPEEELAFPGDYSNGFHKALEDAYIGSLRQRGCQVEPHVRFNEWGDPRYAIADWVARCAGERLPNVNDAKTGPWAKFTRNQNRVYPAIEAGNGFSDDPKMATFGFAPGRIPALVVNRIWSNPRGATPIVDRPFGPMQ